MLRGVAAGMLCRRSSLLSRADGAPFPLSRALHNSAAAPPPAVTAVSEMERRTALERAESAKEELLRQLMLEDATADSSKTAWDKRHKTEQLEDYLRRQIRFNAAGAPVMAAGDKDKHLLLALLVRWTRGEEKLSSNTAKLEELEKKMWPTRILAKFMAKIVFV